MNQHVHHDNFPSCTVFFFLASTTIVQAHQAKTSTNRAQVLVISRSTVRRVVINIAQANIAAPLTKSTLQAVSAARIKRRAKMTRIKRDPRTKREVVTKTRKELVTETKKGARKRRRAEIRIKKKVETRKEKKVEIRTKIEIRTSIKIGQETKRDRKKITERSVEMMIK